MHRNKQALKKEVHQFLNTYLGASNYEKTDQNKETNKLEDQCEKQAEYSYCSESDDCAANANIVHSNASEELIHDDIQFDDIRTKISKWSVEENIAAVSINKLLRILSPHHPTLPLDARTLRNSPRSTPKIQIGGGHYIHYGIKDGLTDFFLNNCYEADLLELNFNIDGLPVSKSSGAQVWPILMSVKNTEVVLTVGVFEGYSKPKNMSEYLEMTICEINELVSDGFEFRGKYFLVKIGVFVCDAPARATIMEIKGHSGYNCCHKCTLRGKRYQNKTIFPYSENTLRTNEAFRARRHSAHHNNQQRIALEDLPIDMVQQFPFDYMHVVCLGVMKTLLRYWIKKRKKPFSLSASKIRSLNTRLAKNKKNSPYEFARKPRSIYEFDRWKATELRNFLLYTGPIILLNILSPERYKHFLDLSTAIRLLLSNDICSYDSANALLCRFVEKIPLLYTKSLLTYNMHCLIHLTADCKMYGPLHTFSAFKFENFLSSIKRQLRKKSQFGAQIYNRMVESSRNGIIKKKQEFRVERIDGTKYSFIGTKSKLISLNHPDNLFVKNNHVYIVQYIEIENNVYFVYGKPIQTDNCSFSNHIKKCISNNFTFQTNDISRFTFHEITKVFQVMLNGNTYFVPLLH